jgi:hypothetical protein
MKYFPHSSRLVYGIFMLLIVMSFLGAFFSMHNALTFSGGKVPMIAILLIVISVLLSLYFIQIVYRSSIEANRITQQFEQLKKSIQESKKQSYTNDENNVVEEIVDYEAESKALIPIESFENEESFIENVLINLSKKIDIVQGLVYKRDAKTKAFSYLAGYAYYTESEPPTFIEGETLPGQVAKNKEILNLSDVPDDYITILSGLGKGSPNHLLIVPIIDDTRDCIGIIELASFKPFNSQMVTLMEKLVCNIGEQLKTFGLSSQE